MATPHFANSLQYGPADSSDLSYRLYVNRIGGRPFPLFRIEEVLALDKLQVFYDSPWIQGDTVAGSVAVLQPFNFLEPVFRATDGGDLPLNLGPPFWFERFANGPTSVALVPPLGNNCWAFLGQGGDGLLASGATVVPWSLQSGSSTVASGNLSQGYCSDGPNLTLPAGQYTFETGDMPYFIAGSVSGTTRVQASFDTSANDPNPPWFSGFGLRSGGHLSDRVVAGLPAVVGITVQDEDLRDVTVTYENGHGPVTIPAVAVAGNTFEASVPACQPGLVALTVTATDGSGNQIQQEFTPGFLCMDCGNGVVDLGEQCDEGAANGTSGSCCNSDCTFRSAGAVCRPWAGACDVPEACTGSSGACPADYNPACPLCTASPTDPENGTYASCAGTASGGTCVLTCNIGYVKSGDARCSNGSWSTESCSLAVCPANASGAPTCTCDSGYTGTLTWGSSWSALGTGMDGDIYALTVDASRNLYAGGDFTTAGGVSASWVAKWNGISWSALGSGMNSHVRALAVDASGNLYAGGYFTTAGGVSASRVAKWSGSSWSALGSGMDNGVLALAVDASGNLYAGGYFTTAGGVAALHVAKWDGSSWSPLGSGMNNGVEALAVDATGNLYAGGYFTTAGGVAALHVAKWDGSSWSALGSGMRPNGVYELAVDASPTSVTGLKKMGVGGEIPQ